MKLYFLIIPALSTSIFSACETPNTGSKHGTNGAPPTLNGKKYPTFGEIERLDPAFNRLIAPDAKIEQLADGFDWSEGPVWVRTKQGHEFLLFSDIPLNKIYKWSEQGGLEEFLHPSGYTGLVPRIGEIIGGSQREERLDVLVGRIEECGMEPQDYWWYVDLRRYGSVPHSGFGLGFERVVQFASGMANIRDVIPFPRTPHNAKF